MSRTCLGALALAVLLAGSWAPQHHRPAARAQTASFLNKSGLHWKNKLRDPSPRVRRSAAFALGRLGDAAYLYIGDLARALETEKDAGVQDMLAMAIAEIVLDYKGDASLLTDRAKPALKNALERSKGASVRRSAAYALGAFGRHAADLTPALETALSDKDASVRQNAAWALGRVWTLTREPTKAEATVLAGLCEPLGKLLSDPTSQVRRDAAGALGHLGRAGAKDATPALLGLLEKDREKDDVVLKAALDALAPVVGKAHRPSAEKLYHLLERKDGDVVRAAALVIGNMGGDEGLRALPHLRKALLDDDDPSMQALAAAAINNIGPRAGLGDHPAVPALQRALERSRDPFVRRNSALALANFAKGLAEKGEKGPPYPGLLENLKPAVPALAAALKKLPERFEGGPKAEAAEEAREHAAEALARMNYPANEKALVAMRDAIRDDSNQGVRQRCVWGLFDLKDLEKHDIDKVLAKVLDEKGNQSKLVRYDAARAFAFAQGPRSPDKAIDVLLKMLADKTLLVYSGTDASLEGTVREGGSAGTRTKMVARDDARYMAAQALGMMGAKVKNNLKAMEALRAAAKDADSEKLRDFAKEALTRLGDEP
jgi:HEAT repeat protein